MKRHFEDDLVNQAKRVKEDVNIEQIACKLSELLDQSVENYKKEKAAGNKDHQGDGVVLGEIKSLIEGLSESQIKDELYNKEYFTTEYRNTNITSICGEKIVEPEVARFLLSQAFEIHEDEEKSFYLIFATLQNHDSDIVLQLIDKGLSSKGSHGQMGGSLLLWTSIYKPELIQEVINRGGRIEQNDDKSDPKLSDLHVAVAHGEPKDISFVLSQIDSEDHKTTLNLPSYENSCSTPLFFAVADYIPDFPYVGDEKGRPRRSAKLPSKIWR